MRKHPYDPVERDVLACDGSFLLVVSSRVRLRVGA